MKISLEGLPGCKKDLIYHILKEEHGYNVLTSQNPEMFELFISNPDRYALSFEIDQLLRTESNLRQAVNETNESNNTPDVAGKQLIMYDSLHSLKEVYLEHLMNKKILNGHEVEIFHRLHHLLYSPPDAIIYFYGDLDKCYERSKSGAKKYTYEEFKNLYV